MKRYWKVGVVGFFALLAFSVQSEAFTYYVAPAASGGSNGNSCEAAKTIGTPKLTINAGAACLAAGDTLMVRPGVYAEIMQNIIPSGTAGNHTIVKSEVQYGAIIRYGAGNQGGLMHGVGAIVFHARNYITFDGFTLDGTGMRPVMHIYFPFVTTNIVIQNNKIFGGQDNGLMDNSMGMAGGHGSSYHTVKNNIIHDIGTGAVGGQGFYGYGIYCYFRDSVIENNEIYNVSGFGMHFYNTEDGDNSRQIFRNNRLHHNGIPSGQSGAIISGGADNQFYNNLSYANGKHGLHVGGYGDPTSNIIVYNNVFHGNGNSCIKIGSQYAPATNTLITNNICYGNAINSVIIEHSGSTGTVQTTNLFGPNPLFVNVGVGNFRLQSGSPAIGTGTNTNSVNPNDHVGTPYSLPKEMGAYDFVTTMLPNLLVFTQPPVSAIIGAALSLVQVCVEDSAGARQTAYATNIGLTISADANPTTTLTGGTAGAPTSGCKSFALSLDKAGSGFKILATSGALTKESGPFNILPVLTVPPVLRLIRVPGPTQ